MRVIVAATGSVAALKIPLLVDALQHRMPVCVYACVGADGVDGGDPRRRHGSCAAFLLTRYPRRPAVHRPGRMDGALFFQCMQI